MGDYERTASERRGSKRLYTAKENAAIRSSKVMSTLSDDAAASRTKERIEAYGNSALYRNIGSDDRINGKVYNNTGNNDSEIKSYAAGYYINGEKRVLAKLDKLTKEDIINYTKKEDIFLNDNEINVIYDEIKNKWKQLYNGNTRVITDLENKINNKAYNKLIDLYNTYKKFLN